MARYAIGDIQGCHDELRELLSSIRFSSDRDRLWFVGDLVNRGPQSLEALRLVRSLDASAVCVLGNHDLHLLAVAYGVRSTRRGDTLDAILAASDRDRLLEWLLTRPLAHHDRRARDLLVHAGLVPQWSVADVLRLAAEVERALREDPRRVLAHMYGDAPDRWDEALAGTDRLRVIINVLTRLRACTPDGRIDLAHKGPPQQIRPPLRPWYELECRAFEEARVIVGHWSALGLWRTPRALALDTGCVWGGRLTAVDLDDAARPPACVPCRGHRTPGAD